MARVLLTKNELKKQRDALKLFSRYLPTLQLKKQQLQTVLRRISEELDSKRKFAEEQLLSIQEWIAVLGEQTRFEEYLMIKEIRVAQSSIAGIEIPVFQEIIFEPAEYDLFTTPLWVDMAIENIKALFGQFVEIDILQEQYRQIHEELIITNQRVNLFEKVKIPQARDIIRSIQISIADEQTAAIVRGKISKRKMAEHKE